MNHIGLYLRLFCYPLLAISLAIYSCNLHPLKHHICKVHLSLCVLFISLWGHSIITLVQKGVQNGPCCVFMNYVVVPIMFATIGILWRAIYLQARENRKGVHYGKTNNQKKEKNDDGCRSTRQAEGIEETG